MLVLMLTSVLKLTLALKLVLAPVLLIIYQADFPRELRESTTSGQASSERDSSCCSSARRTSLGLR